jgi:hypothetical protein
LRRKNSRLMSRVSLKLSIAMAVSDAVYHVRRSNRHFYALSLTSVLLGFEFLWLSQYVNWLRLRVCRRLDVRHIEPSVDLLCLRYCLEYPIAHRTSASAKAQRANPFFCHATNRRPPHL